MKIGNLKEKVSSRKFIIMSCILMFGMMALSLPALLAYAGVKIPLILSGSEFVSLIVSSFGIYSGANVWQKKLDSGKNTELSSQDQQM